MRMEKVVVVAVVVAQHRTLPMFHVRTKNAAVHFIPSVLQSGFNPFHLYDALSGLCLARVRTVAQPLQSALR